MRKSFPLYLIVVSVLLVAGLWSYSQAVGGTIEVCIRKNGAVFVIGEGFRRASCRGNDTLMTWNVTGAPGPQGEKGDKGDKGDPGSSLHLFDASGQDVGMFLDHYFSGGRSGNSELSALTSFMSYTVFLPEKNIRVYLIPRVDSDGTVEVEINTPKPTIYFESNDCTNGAFIKYAQDFLPLDTQTLLSTSEPRYFKPVSPAIPGPAQINSYLNPIMSNVCKTYSEATTTTAALEEVILPFSLPIVWPLEIKEN